MWTIVGNLIDRKSPKLNEIRRERPFETSPPRTSYLGDLSQEGDKIRFSCLIGSHEYFDEVVSFDC